MHCAFFSSSSSSLVDIMALHIFLSFIAFMNFIYTTTPCSPIHLHKLGWLRFLVPCSLWVLSFQVIFLVIYTRYSNCLILVFVSILLKIYIIIRLICNRRIILAEITPTWSAKVDDFFNLPFLNNLYTRPPATSRAHTQTHKHFHTFQRIYFFAFIYARNFICC